MKIDAKTLKEMIKKAIIEQTAPAVQTQANTDTMTQKQCAVCKNQKGKPCVCPASKTEKPEQVINEKTSTTWGVLPSADELYKLMDGEDFKMDLKGADSLAFQYAMMLSDNRLAGSLKAGEGMLATLQALVDAPDPSDESALSDDKYEIVSAILDTWYERYENESIADTAHSIASSIMDVLGVEWI